jgi:hypothetical protein
MICEKMSRVRNHLDETRPSRSIVAEGYRPTVDSRSLGQVWIRPRRRLSYLPATDTARSAHDSVKA